MKKLLIISLLFLIGCDVSKEIPKIKEKSTLFIYDCEKLSRLTKLETKYAEYVGNGGGCLIFRKANAPLVLDSEGEMARLIWVLEQKK